MVGVVLSDFLKVPEVTSVVYRACRVGYYIRILTGKLMDLPVLDGTLKKKTSLARRERRPQSRMYKAELVNLSKRNK